MTRKRRRSILGIVLARGSRRRREHVVYGLDDLIAGWGETAPLLVALGVALLLGLRHAADPDHLVAVSTLVAGDPERPTRRAAWLGLAWGSGHAVTLLALGIPVLVFHRHLPEALHQAAELLVGLVIVALALVLLVRWRRGRFHVHEHEHDGVRHRHLHGHDESTARAQQHEHEHEHPPVRSPLQAFGLGLVHGVGGSAAVGILLFASIDDGARATAALVVFALGTAVSMAALTGGLGYLLGRGPVRRSMPALAPVLGVTALAFGAWYAAGALA